MRARRELFRVRAVDIDLSLQEGAFFNGNTLRRDVSGDRSGLPQVHAVTGLNITFQLSLHHDGFGVDAGLDLAVWAHGEAVALQGDAALDLAVQVEIFASRKFALNYDRLADLRQTTGGCAHWTRSCCKGISAGLLRNLGFTEQCRKTTH